MYIIYIYIYHYLSIYIVNATLSSAEDSTRWLWNSARTARTSWGAELGMRWWPKGRRSKLRFRRPHGGLSLQTYKNAEEKARKKTSIVGHVLEIMLQVWEEQRKNFLICINCMGKAKLNRDTAAVLSAICQQVFDPGESHGVLVLRHPNWTLGSDFCSWHSPLSALLVMSWSFWCGTW